jgi:erythromycin esterase
VARAKLSRCVVAATFLATLLSGNWSLAQSTAPVTEWVRGNAIRLTTPEAGHGFQDMEPLEQVAGNARIVSLGEATHGSREFFQVNQAAPANFDAILFVEKTTAARRNPPVAMPQAR